MPFTCHTQLVATFVNSKSAPDFERLGNRFQPSSHFIVTDQNWLHAAAKAVRCYRSKIKAHYLQEIGVGAFSLEIQLKDLRLHQPIMRAYNAACDKLGLH